MGDDEQHIVTLSSEELSVLPYGEPKKRIQPTQSPTEQSISSKFTNYSMYPAMPNKDKPIVSHRNDLPLINRPNFNPNLILDGTPSSQVIAFAGVPTNFSQITVSDASHNRTANNVVNEQLQYGMGSISPLSTTTDCSLPCPNTGIQGNMRARSNSFGNFGHPFPASLYLPISNNQTEHNAQICTETNQFTFPDPFSDIFFI
ncbi:hypothetical protein HDV01_004764 [Terramyces sp. JEL0728]|nr:hypothetical protein HDV01_004764 [Terramyces sp. JEL0728]